MNLSKKFNSALSAVFIAFLFFFAINSYAQQLTLEQIFDSDIFDEEGLQGMKSMKDGKSFSSIISDNGQLKIMKFSYETGLIIGTIAEYKDLIIPGTNEKITSYTYTFSPDETKILFPVLKDRLYRHSTINYFYIYDVNSKNINKVSDRAGMYAEFSPDGNNIAFVSDNNLFTVDLETYTEKQITNDGKKEHYINGMTDWVYEEEFGLNRGFFWSPAGDKIAFYKFDESNVKEFSLTYYEGLYPREYKYKYPKPGEENSKVWIHIYDLNNGMTTEVDSPNETDYYIPRVKWTADNNTLSFQVLNRHQNKLDLYFTDASTGKLEKIFSHTDKGYLKVNEGLTFIEGNKNFIWEENDNLYLYDIKGNLVNNITSGKNDLEKFLGYDEKNKKIFYTSSIESPMTRLLYSVNIDGTNNKKLSEKAGWNKVQFSADFSFYINDYSDILTPSFYTLNNSEGKVIRTLVTNSTLKDITASYKFNKPEFFSFKLNETVEGTDIDNLNGFMFKPANFNPAKQYPVIFYTYGGPGSQTVKDEWLGESYYWFQYLAREGFIVVSIDNRGTTGRGDAFEKSTYLKLGQYEAEDMIAAAKYLGTLPYVDKENIGVYGWSYGGYMAALCITLGADYFKAAAAVAPVTNWRFYDNIYTERYMRTPDENKENYDNYSPLFNVNKIKGDFLLIHGMADDNVHLQNSTEMMAEMVKNNIKFDSEFYPDKNHGIYGGKTRLHLFTRITDFFLKSLKSDSKK